MLRAASLVLITLLVHHSYQSEPTNCPSDPSIHSPCKCTGYTSWGDIGPHMHCGGDQKIDLAGIFKRLSEYYEKQGADKIFDQVIVNNSAITEIKDNDFADLRFGTVSIFNCFNLVNVSNKAFGDPSLTGEFYWVNNPKVPTKQVFALADSFQAQDYTIDGVDEVPAYAIHRRDSRQYSDGLAIFLYGDNLKTIQPRAFANITVEHHSFPSPQGVFIDIVESGIASFPDEAFTVNTDKLRIEFQHNSRLSGQSFSKNTFKIGSNVQTILQFEPVVSYLDEIPFTTFFEDNPKNAIEIRDSVLDCSDQRNRWLSKFADRISVCDIESCKPFKPCQQ